MPHSDGIGKQTAGNKVADARLILIDEVKRHTYVHDSAINRVVSARLLKLLGNGRGAVLA